MEVFDKIEALYKKAEEITDKQREINRQIDDNKRDLEKYRPEMIMILSDASKRIQSSISEIPRNVHVTEEYGLNKQTKILGWAVLVTIILTASMVIWLMPKAELEYIRYQQTKISEQEEKLDYFISKNPKTLKSWNELHSQ